MCLPLPGEVSLSSLLNTESFPYCPVFWSFPWNATVPYLPSHWSLQEGFYHPKNVLIISVSTNPLPAGAADILSLYLLYPTRYKSPGRYLKESSEKTGCGLGGLSWWPLAVKVSSVLSCARAEV